MIVFGLNEVENLRIMATTFLDGDPSYAGPLAGLALGIKSYHMLELKSEIPPDVWAAEMAMEELELEDETATKLVKALREVRGES